ncbi:hypothetical protein WA1_23970 [Scytonema hofmannii PCC 7110]|uniref:Uncharacterized protein n=1 Tax=Scytonema hofmannii PCC 7110 TaxID=128403 RepID=A0A139X7M0_9CYAN|nr:hypothetical protein [Scytonema hofmannii]KYC40701.1 hypothetical protein WA1_23970 [Scytonema hofmannii PCC 7110]
MRLTSTTNTTKVNADLEVRIIDGSLKGIKVYYRDNSIKSFLDGFKDAKIQGIDIEFIKAESLLDEEDLFDDEEFLED